MIYILHTLRAIFFLILTGLSLVTAQQANIKVITADELSQQDTLISAYEMPQIEVIGRKPGLLNRVPGSAKIISRQELARIDALSGNEVFRRITGLYPVDEEGAGLRLNLGVRGLEPDRSRTVLMLEDGVPVSLAPYGEPEMYYTPPIDRMAGLEVLKGSGSILFGPQTIGGVINFITADPPAAPTGSIKLRGGENGFFTTLAKYGTTFGNVGAQINYLLRQVDNIGTATYRINDLSAKFKLTLGLKSIIGIKVGAYDEISNSTYVGLTQIMYERGEYYTRIAPADQLIVRRYSASATHDLFITSTTFLRTTVFGYTTSRNWRRQDFGRTSSVSNKTGVVFGDPGVPGGAIYMRNSTGNRNRQFEVAGIEPRLTTTYKLGEYKNELDLGVRFLYERAFEQYVIGTKFNSSSGNLRDDEIRTGYARSAFVQNRLFVTDKLIISPGLRFESFSYERNIMRGQFKISNITAVRDTSVIAENTITEFIPGLGINYQLAEGSSVFAGVHRGFAPPRVKDAITSDGVALQLDAELSWNYEVGARFTAINGLSLEVTGFLLDFSNQIIPVSQSSGSAGTGLINGGRSKHIGIEAGVTIDAGRLFESRYSFSLTTNATYVKATYNADRFITEGNTTINISDNSLPYAPKFTLSNALSIATPFGLSAQLSALYVDKQFTDEFNTATPSADGLTGVIPAYLVLDLSTSYFISSLNTSISLSVKNLLDERYIVTRRPSGIRAGVPRIITAGIDFKF